MVNKPNLNMLLDDFQDSVDGVLGHWWTLHELVPKDLPARRKISEDCLVSLMQLWETFRSDWQVYSVTRDSRRFVQHLEGKLQLEAARGISRVPGASVTVHSGLGDHPTTQEIRSILDAKGRNVTYSDRDEHDRAARQQLADRQLRKAISLTDDDWRLLNLTKACRNVIAHRSKYSLREFNTAIHSIRESSLASDAHLGRRETSVRMTGVGTYLYGSVNLPTMGQARVKHMGERLQGIGEKLR
ncbi:MAG: hypothetical protein L0G99_02340 [Propionibacteriales bacterium]|nr:hypothetical protein [Propionibacteriales bacterium]